MTPRYGLIATVLPFLTELYGRILRALIEGTDTMTRRWLPAGIIGAPHGRVPTFDWNIMKTPVACPATPRLPFAVAVH